MPDTASFWNERGAWLRKEATALRNRQEFQRSQLTELANNDFESWAKESFEIATKIDYRNGGRIGIPKGGNMDCTMIATAPVLPVGYVVSASRIADRRMILAAYRLADRPTRVTRNFDCRRSIQFNYTVTFDMSDRHRLPVLLVHPFSPDWYVGGSVLVPGRSSSIVEIGSGDRALSVSEVHRQHERTGGMVRAGGCSDRGGRMLGSARELNGQIRAPLCPRCKGYLGIVVPEQKAKMPA